MTSFRVKLGMKITNFNLDEATGTLIVSGPACEEGVWTGMDGKARFFPRQVLRNGAHLFNDVPFVCEHLGTVIGHIKTVEPTELGFNVTEAYTKNPQTIKAIMTGEKTGFSIECEISLDPIRNVVDEILSAINISLVGTPACTVCGINNMHFVENINEGTNMIEEKIEEGAGEQSIEIVDSSIVESPDVLAVVNDTEPVELALGEAVETPVEVVETVIADQPTQSNFANILDKLESIATNFTSLFSKINASKVNDIALSTELDVESDEPVDELVITEDAQIIEIVVDTPVIDETLSRLGKLEESFELITETLSTILDNVSAFDVQTANLSAQIKSINDEKIALSTTEDTKITALIKQIVAIDSTSNVEVLSSMNFTQLSTYKDKVESLMSPTVGASKLSKMRNQAAPPVDENNKMLNREEVLDYLVKDLAKKEKRN